MSKSINKRHADLVRKITYRPVSEPPHIGQKVWAWCETWPENSDHPFLAVRTDTGFYDVRRGQYMAGVSHWLPVIEGPRA